ncbi:MAG: hypothetical protein JWN66_2243 [Sphingomonas bacterium]|uniref:hypothetical protein n=1 Tax=Sphingomonas bacterium TaxID=1895847 RepID=UPI00262BA9BB|nr:hypothetical protein [Sphingomonas bacterium]MDB5705127.1 hypothetical protein [Sphingomonas bacterium]
MVVEAILTWLSGGIPKGNPADQDIARHAYADFLGAQVAGFLPDDKELKEELGKARDKLDAHDKQEANEERTRSFSTLMGIETRLAGKMSDDQVSRNYWIVRDRFNRVASQMGIDEHVRWAPPELREPQAVAADSPLATAKLARNATLAEAGRTAIALAEATAIATAAGAAATPVQKDAVTAAQTANDAAVAAVKAADKRVADLEAAEAKAAEALAALAAANQAAATPAPAPDVKKDS